MAMPFGIDSDAGLNAAWARRAGLISHLPRSALSPCLLRALLLPSAHLL